LPTTPASLLERLRTPGQAEAWGRFVELYSPLLFQWARLAKLQEADAADLVQDVFTVLVKKLPEFDYDATKGFRRWLRTVALNKWRDGLRRRTPEPLIGDPEAPLGDEPFWEIEHRQLVTRRLLEMMQAEFEPMAWKAFLGMVVDGRSAAEVGGELNMTAGAVRAAKFRVLSRLRSELDGLLD